MQTSTLLLLGGGIVALIALSKKGSDSKSEGKPADLNSGNVQTASFNYPTDSSPDEIPVIEENDELPEDQKEFDDQQKQEIEEQPQQEQQNPEIDPAPANPQIQPGIALKKGIIGTLPNIPKPTNPVVPWNKPQPIGKLKNIPYVPPTPKPGIGMQMGQMGVNEQPWQKFIIKNTPTPGFYYKVKTTDFGTPPSGSRPAESFDPLFHIVKQAYNRQAYTDFANASIARDVNNHPYNQRFRHLPDPLFNPNQKMDLSKKYGTLEDQYNDPQNGSYRNYNLQDASFPTIFIPSY